MKKPTIFYYKTILIYFLFLLIYVDSKAQSLDFTSIDTIAYSYKVQKMIGKNAPDWILKEGNFKSLFDLKGYVVLLEFSGIGCGPCKIVEKDVNDLASLYREKRLKIVIIEASSSNKKEAQIDFIPRPRYGLGNYVDLVDILNKYGVSGFPTFFLIDKNGVIKYTHVSYFHDNSRARMIERINAALL